MGASSQSRSFSMESWKTVSNFLLLTAKILKAEWRAALPAPGSLPSETTEQLCDAWCERIAGDVLASFHPPSYVQPWILARFVAMAVSAIEFHRNGENGAPTMSPSTVRALLIGEWHDRLRVLWPSMKDLPDVSDS